uniref:Uncharacterized protein n=1 Tax=Avena sativa TaxID=4498 RepID=A0ACD5YPD7_AVESA
MARLPGLRCCDIAVRGSLPSLGLAHPPHRPRRSPRVPALRYSSLQAGDSLGEEEVMRMFLEDRQMNGDFISKVADMVLRRSGTTYEENAADFREDVTSEATGDLVSADGSLTDKRRRAYMERKKESDKRREFNLLRYEAIKDELLLLTAGIGAACTIYCVLVFSLEAGISYAFGVAFSWLYLQLLYRRADNLSKEDVPEVFLRKTVKKIGIRSEDLKNTVEKTLGGSIFVLSSPRLIIPAVIFGLSTLSNHFHNSIFNFELVPGMMGFFAYKAAALVQVYRDNDDLRLILPDDDPDYS